MHNRLQAGSADASKRTYDVAIDTILCTGAFLTADQCFYQIEQYCSGHSLTAVWGRFTEVSCDLEAGGSGAHPHHKHNPCEMAVGHGTLQAAVLLLAWESHLAASLWLVPIHDHG